MLTINDLSQIFIDGLDAETFLQRQLTCDVTQVQVKQCTLAAYCNRQGYIEALGWLSRTDIGFALLVPSELSELVLQRFKKYGAFSKIALRIEQPDFELSWAPQDQLLCVEGHHLSLAEPVASWCRSFAKSKDVWRAYWLSHGIACLDQATTGLFRPHDLHLIEHGAVSMTKGCYPGQEIVARMHYLGKIKQRSQRLWLNTAQTLSPGQVLGPITLIDAIHYDGQRWALNALIRDDVYQQLPHTYDFGELQPWAD